MVNVTTQTIPNGATITMNSHGAGLSIGPAVTVGASGQVLTGTGSTAWVNSPLTTSIGNVNNGNLHGMLNSIFLDERTQLSANVKKYQVFDITEDLLALSTCWQRIRNDKNYVGQRPENITDELLFSMVNFEDKKKAEKIRDYYSKKFTLWALNGVTLTPFREDLKKFIHSDGKIFKEDMKPLVYRLPEIGRAHV